MTFGSDSSSSPKRSLPIVEASTSETTKKPKVEGESTNQSTDDVAKRLQQLQKSDRKKYHRAKRLGQRADIVNGALILHPKIHLRHQNDCASFSTIRNLILGIMLQGTKLPKGIEILERQRVTKAVVVDIPMAPSLEEHYTMVSKSFSPDVYQQWMAPPYLSFLHHLGLDPDNHDCEDEYDAFGKVASGMCDRRNGLADRFGQILQCKLSRGQIKQLRQQANEDARDLGVPADDLVLTVQELINNEYPLHSSLLTSPLEDGWIETPAARGSDTRKKLLAMDCEMCRSGRRLVLTKVALVDQDHKVLLNEFVKPDCVITDYVTDYSGVDEASLKGVTTTLHDIQQQLLQHIDGNTILVGHGLVNDLRVLKMRHAHIIDTSVIYHHANGPPYKPSLKDLTTMILHRHIQQKQAGHDPCEDAIASLELVQLKMKKGLKFGLHADYMTELIVDRLAAHGKTGTVIDACDSVGDALLAKELTDHPQVYTASSSKAAVALALEQHAMNDLILLKLKRQDGSEVMDQVQWLYDHLEPDTALIMLAGGFNTDELDRLRKKWYTYKADLKTRPLDEIPDGERWTEQDEQRLDTLVELAKRYYIIPCIKY